MVPTVNVEAEKLYVSATSLLRLLAVKQQKQVSLPHLVGCCPLWVKSGQAVSL